MRDFDFIAVGDITTDAFIKLQDAEVHASRGKKPREICMEFGTKLPYESATVVAAVGNAANAAVAAARLGLSSALVADQGEDENGKKHLEVLHSENVFAGFIKRHENMATNYHYVLWFGNERTILVKHEKYSYSFPPIGKPKWVYLSSLGSGTLPYHIEIKEYLQAHPAIKFAFQPGTFQMELGTGPLGYFYSHAEVFICNVQEAEKILNLKTKKIKTLLAAMHKMGPKIVLITDGPNGAYMSDGETAWFMPPYPDPKPPLERTGAGDAFASTFVAALALGLDPKQALMWAPINSMSVVQEIGAQKGLLTQKDIHSFLSNAPATYIARKI